jgi:hypothetical protein
LLLEECLLRLLEEISTSCNGQNHSFSHSSVSNANINGSLEIPDQQSLRQSSIDIISGGN